MSMYQRINGADWRNIFVVGDLHGCYTLLMNELEKVSFDPAHDLLISVGDLVDRGAENVECLELITMPWFRAVRGNHEQMMIDGRGQIKILPGDERLNYKPCVDITFGSAAKAYADKVLAVVLTGMGADGRDGARMLKEAGSQVWAQDEASCVIYGMPMAVVKANLADAVYSLDDIGRHLAEACN